MIVPLLMALTFAALVVFLGLSVVTARSLAASAPSGDGGGGSTGENAGWPSPRRPRGSATSVR